MTTTVTTPVRTLSPLATAVAARVTGAVLALGVGYVHVVDQGGIIGDKAPRYVGVGYWIVELVAIAVAALLVSGRSLRTAWVLALGIGAGPMVGYILSRGPGLPNYTDDRGNWTEPIGVISLALEAALIVLTLTALARRRRA